MQFFTKQNIDTFCTTLEVVLKVSLSHLNVNLLSRVATMTMGTCSYTFKCAILKIILFVLLKVIPDSFKNRTFESI